jgi:hypothetical protein
MPTIDLRAWFSYPGDETPDPMPDDTFIERTLILRQAGLGSSDWRVLPDVPGDPAPWIAYRANLRDGPAILATRDGDLVTLPDPPS